MGERKGPMDNEHGATFGTRLRWFRQREGLTIEELAEKAGLSSRGIGDIERGDRQTPYRNTVELLAKALTLSDEERDDLIRLRRMSVAISRLPSCGREPASTATSATTIREASVSAVTPTRSFPQSLTRLIGRDLVIAAIRDILVARETRLLTLTGSGGVGKNEGSGRGRIYRRRHIHRRRFFCIARRFGRSSPCYAGNRSYIRR